MMKQTRFLCIGGFLNGAPVKDQGESFVSVESSKNVKYRKLQIKHPDVVGSFYYVSELLTDQQAKNWVYNV